LIPFNRHTVTRITEAAAGDEGEAGESQNATDMLGEKFWRETEARLLEVLALVGLRLRAEGSKLRARVEGSGRVRRETGRGACVLEAVANHVLRIRGGALSLPTYTPCTHTLTQIHTRTPATRRVAAPPHKHSAHRAPS